MEATNRQKKLLSFFGIQYAPNISTGAAGWEIGGVMADDANRERWRRYLYLTKDFSSDSPITLEFDNAELERIQIPDDWSSSEEMQKIKDEIVAEDMPDGSPFDHPAPDIEFSGHSFIFTGKLDFGTRKLCQEAVVKRGGIASSQKSVTQKIDYLVIGSGGSKAWKRGSYGNKIEAAIVSRREYGTPAIISETDWMEQMKNA